MDVNITEAGSRALNSLSGKLVFQQSEGRIVGIDNSGVPRLCIIADGAVFIFRISQEGKNVLTCSADELIFNSADNQFKIFKKFDLTVDVVNSPGNYGYYYDTTPHGLTGAKAYIGFVDSSLGGRTMLPDTEYVVLGAPGSQYMQAGTVKSIDIGATDITAKVETTTYHNNSYKFTVYVLQETAG